MLAGDLLSTRYSPPGSAVKELLASSNAIAARKLAPLRDGDRAGATAGQEREDETAPRPVASASVLGLPSPGGRVIIARRISAWMTAGKAGRRRAR